MILKYMHILKLVFSLFILCHHELFTISSISDSVIVSENLRIGTRDWWISQPLKDPDIQGFTTSFSYNPGDQISFKIDCRNLIHSSFQLQIYRLGYYNGTGGRLLDSITVKRDACSNQVPCMFERNSRMVDCGNWKPSLHWTVPQEALSGVYVALPVAKDEHKNSTIYGGYIPFVVRHQYKRKVDILFKTSDLTWVAYNKYGGWNVYGGNGSKAFSTRALKASYNRPFANRLVYPLGQQQNFLFSTEFPMLFWLEKHGFDVAYAGCSDIELSHEKGLLKPTQVKVLLSVGHDEYWTPKMKLAFTSARNEGVHLGFFSGNEMFWRVIWEEEYSKLTKFSSSIVKGSDLPFDLIHQKMMDYVPSKSNDECRVFICKKETIDNIGSTNSEDSWTGTFVDPRHRKPTPENEITGQRFMVNSYRNDSLIVSVADAKLRLWRHTNVLLHGRHHASPKPYRSPNGVLGYELDGYLDDLFRPPGLISLSHTPLTITNSFVEDYGASYIGSGSMSHRLTMYRYHIPSYNSNPENHVCSRKSVVEYLNSSLVFATGTIQWPWALSSFRDGDVMEEDLNLQQATINILADMDVFPASLNTKSEKESTGKKNSGKGLTHQLEKLHLAKASSDQNPPKSTISGIGLFLNKSMEIKYEKNRIAISRTNFAQFSLKVTGAALDGGKGKVASVEISLNGGKSWHVASGRERWTYTFHFGKNSATFGFHDYNHSLEYPRFDVDNGLQNFRENLIHSSMVYDEYTPLSSRSVGSLVQMVIISRAVDDSGWIERTGYEIEQTLCKTKSGEICSMPNNNCNLSNNIRVISIEITE